MSEHDKYTEDGVNIDLGDAFSKYAGDIARESYANNPYVAVVGFSNENFRGPRGFNLIGLPSGCSQTLAPDGSGTKSIIIDAAGTYGDAANDVVAMTATDIVRYGGFPLVFTNILDVKTLGVDVDSRTFRAAKALMQGLGEIARLEGFVILNGETAELSECVGSSVPGMTLPFNWAGVMHGVYHPDKMILGDTLAPGQVIIALRDNFRSNGISSVRKALAMLHGPKWAKRLEPLDDVVASVTPSKPYSRLISVAHGWYNAENNFRAPVKIHLFAHLSGGGIDSKLGSDLLEPLGLSADLPDLYEPSEIMQKLAKARGMSEEECYRSWNGGQGALVVVDREDVETFFDIAEYHDVDCKVAGEIVERQKYNVRVVSKFDSGKDLYY